MEHTPTPWILDGRDIRPMPNGELMATAYIMDDGDEAKALANARLMAAAPELLQALKAALPLATRGLHWYQAKWTANPTSERAGHEDGLIATLEAVNEAIAKAEGEK